MKELNRETSSSQRYTNRVIQFGEGNFLRAFVDWIIEQMNQKIDFDCGVTVVQPIAQGMCDMVNAQDGLYHLVLKGMQNGEATRTITRIDVINDAINPYSDFQAYMALAEALNNRFIVSNTTEAGIAFCETDRFEDSPASSYPGKLTQLLYRRFEVSGGAADSGFIILPCELIDRNGDNLKRVVAQYIDMWSLGDDFSKWVDESNYFANTLVDRIVPGFPRETIGEIQEQIGYKDNLVVEGEVFHLWVVEGDEIIEREFPANKAGLNVLFAPSMKPYRDRKVGLLNAPHTVLSPVGYLSGLDTVRECVEDELIGDYVRRVIYGELLPTLDLPEEELRSFADSVVERFLNPYVKHNVTSIMLNSFSKFKSRDLPLLKIYKERKGALPEGLVIGLAGILIYYKGGKRGEDQITPNDSPEIIELLNKLWSMGSLESVVSGVLSATDIWAEDLTHVDGLESLLLEKLKVIESSGMKSCVEQYCINH
ncbi:MAG: tagaturonate reductase [Rikenellaceae bacterium]